MTNPIKKLAACVAVLVAIAVTSTAHADALKKADAEKLFATKVLPLFESKCIACHGGDKTKAEFDMTTLDRMLKGGESGDPALVPGDPVKSLIYVAVTWEDELLEMPPKENDRLTAEQVAMVRDWIAAGAPWPSAERIAAFKKEAWAEPDAEGGIIVPTSGGLSDDWTYRRYDPADLWAYKPVKRPRVPNTAEHPVDAFINARLAEKNLRPAPAADKRTLIRRATYDLTGLPPTAAEIDAFVNDSSPKAWETLIDRLLASPHYGERMAQHWLDVVRYADTAGFSNDFARPNAWRYRDYVIRAFNEDKPYDDFVREQVAGDEIDPNDVDHLVAVGFLRMGPWEQTGMSVAAVTRQLFLDDVVNSVGVTFLGTELRCAKCHDHKFDPIPTRDYYRMQAVFAPVNFAHRNAPYQPYENTDGMGEAKAQLEARMKAGGVKSLHTIPKSEWPVEKFDADTEKKGHNKVNRKQRQTYNAEKLRFQPWAFSVYNGPLNVPRSGRLIPLPAAKKLKGKPEQIHILTGGSIETPAEPVTPGVLSVVEAMRGKDKPGRAASVTPGMNGRRTQLADWLTSDNPMTARVMVNRVWQWHFGEAIAANPNNFGKTGKRPTHPRLLDFLATRFVEDGWSFKKLHKLIMTSDAYRRASAHPNPDTVAKADPTNQLLSHFRVRRLTAEELRDAMLRVSGELNTKMGGIPARPAVNMEVAMQPRHIMGSVAPAYQPNLKPAQRNRRTIYAERIRTMRDPMLEVFNQPGLDTSCERRDSSTIAPQAFTLLNSVNSYDRAIAFAQRVRQAANKPAAQVDAAFALALGRAPSAAERDKAIDHLKSMTRHHRTHTPVKSEPPKYVIREMVEEMTGLNFYWVEHLDVFANPAYEPDTKPWDVDAETRALADLCLVLFNTNEFIYVF